MDVQQLVKIGGLPRTLADRLHPEVRAKYHELWDGLRAIPRKYVRLWPSELTGDAMSIDEMIDGLSGAVDELQRMRADGVTLERTAAGHHKLVTEDPAVAEKYDMHDELDFFTPGDRTE